MGKQMVFGFINIENKKIVELTPFNKELEDMLMELIEFYGEDFEGDFREVNELDMIILLIMDKHKKMKNQQFLDSIISGLEGDC
ncbi:hypothetical protein [Priestia aryabhattai]|uniref:hypothetical protein n=1 Tax=Priestia aryabhattai TaxID=412384 RepID=UPI0005ED3452|nr:hypothetical protein [Priestia aryabhattai]KJL04354.1 hypothetical protein N178_12555 [Priestia aryabhattai B8W22]